MSAQRLYAPIIFAGHRSDGFSRISQLVLPELRVDPLTHFGFRYVRVEQDAHRVVQEERRLIEIAQSA
ncbi:hypothetical protein Dcae01_02845 [Deinococcus caeni]|uniref:Uncharacterized protein n=1 Tax=Deinococcus caeni TaxID=569127 RepID=A0ABP9UEZ3_9DEIO